MKTDRLQARAFWLAAPGHGEIRPERLVAPGPDEVLVRALYTGISRGTESLVFRGEVPPSQYRAMRAPFQQGEFPAPVKYGYCNVGVVETGPEALSGRIVFCLYPHQDRYVVPAVAVTPVPPRVPPARVARLAGRLPGCRIQLVDVDPGRAVIAERLGVGFARPDRAEGGQDLLIHASGAPAGLATALGLAGFEAVVVEASWFGARPVSLPLGEDFHARRLSIRSSQVGGIAAAQRGRWDHRRRMATVMELLEDPVWDALIDGESLFADLPRVMAELSRDPPGALCHRIIYAD